MDIRDSGDSKGDGEYWIDAENNGNPLKVYCDMTTDGGEIQMKEINRKKLNHLTNSKEILLRFFLTIRFLTSPGSITNQCSKLQIFNFEKYR